MNSTRDNIIKHSIILLLFIGTCIIFFPGSYSVDSWSIYRQVQSGNYGDWYSPMIAVTWRWLISITGKFSIVFILQMFVYWLAASVLLIGLNKSWCVFFTGLACAYFFIFIPQYVMKDTHTALTWMLAIVLMLNQYELDNKVARFSGILIILVMLVYGFYVRINAVAGFIPLLYLFTEQYLTAESGWGKKILVLALSLALLIGGYLFVTYNLLDTKREYPEYKLRLLDVVGISKLSGKNYIPDCVRSYKHYDEHKLLKLYSPASIDDIYWPRDGSVPVIPNSPDSQLNGCVAKAWNKAVMENPVLYVKNRYHGFLYYLRVKERFKPDEYWNVAIWMEPKNPIGLKRDEWRQPGKWAPPYSRFTKTPFYSPWLWLVIGTVFFLIYIILYMRRKAYQYKIMAFMQLSAMLYLLSQFPVYQHDKDFRYNYWNVLAAGTGLVYLNDRKYLLSERNRRPPNCPNRP